MAISHGRTVHVIGRGGAVRQSTDRQLKSSGFDVSLYSTWRQFFAALPTTQMGAPLFDLWLLGIEGPELQSRFNEPETTWPTIVLTGQGDARSVVIAMKANALDSAKLLIPIELAFSWIDLELDAAEAARRLASLSLRERQVLDGLVAGRSHKVIAFDLKISMKTVEMHRSRMMARLGLHHRSEAIRLSILAGLVRPERGAPLGRVTGRNPKYKQVERRC
jgi:two-component system response regulator FixJ